MHSITAPSLIFLGVSVTPWFKRNLADIFVYECKGPVDPIAVLRISRTSTTWTGCLFSTNALPSEKGGAAISLKRCQICERLPVHSPILALLKAGDSQLLLKECLISCIFNRAAFFPPHNRRCKYDEI